MKTLLLIMAAAVPLDVQTVSLWWNYPALELPFVSFEVKATTNDTLQPPDRWPTIAHITGTNLTVTVKPGVELFAVRASNSFGYSDFAMKEGK